jgi:membrane associated rhomboid family serine protease
MYLTKDEASRKLRAQMSYRTALRGQSRSGRLARISWVTWIITLGTTAMWCFTAYQVALASDAHSFHDILVNVFNNTQNANVLVTYGAKDNSSILAGQYWRFITPIFLHANLLHVGLNMLNFFILGIFIERLFGHLRFLLIYLVTGVISVIASFYFAPQEVSVGASGAIFGIVGAYSVFVLMHRRAFRAGGIPILLWLVLVIGLNLGLGFFIANIDNYAHLGGLISGFLLGWLFAPLYVQLATGAEGVTQLVDVHSLSRRWPFALLTILATLLLAILALHFVGG